MGRYLISITLVAACGGGSSGAIDGNPGGDGRPPVDGSADPGVDAAPSLCGDGLRVRGEECDDHNTANGDGCDSSCRVEPYAGAPQAAIDAMHAMNALRAAADVPGAHLESHVVLSSQNHATYYATNAAAYAADPNLSAHQEASGYPGFTGVEFPTRMGAAGFGGNAMFETMAFSANPTAAVDQWLNTVFHRIPMLHPNMTQFGYANAASRANDVADYSSGAAERQGAVIVWPAPGATGVARQFSTTQEGPRPPAAPDGSTTTGPLVSVFFASGANGTLTSHTIKDAGGTVLPITTIAPNDATFGPFMMGSYCFYGNAPAAAGTYTVDLAGTVNGQAFTRSWTFTTQ